MIQQIILLFCVCFLQYELWFGMKGIDRWLGQRRSYQDQLVLNEQLDDKISQLDHDLQYSNQNDWYEHQSREKWGFVSDDETLVLFKDDD